MLDLKVPGTAQSTALHQDVSASQQIYATCTHSPWPCLKPHVMHMQVQDMAEQCAASGISIKYGKKVLGRLERVASARQELTAAMGAGELTRLQAAVNEARGLRRSELLGAMPACTVRLSK